MFPGPSSLTRDDSSLRVRLIRIEEILIVVSFSGPKLSRNLGLAINKKQISAVFQARESGSNKRFRWICPEKPKIFSDSTISIDIYEARETVFESAFSERKRLHSFELEGSSIYTAFGAKPRGSYDFDVSFGEYQISVKALVYTKDHHAMQVVPPVLANSSKKLETLLVRIYGKTGIPLGAVSASNSLQRICEEAASTDEDADIYQDVCDFGETIWILLNHLDLPTSLNARRLQESDKTLASVFEHIVDAERLLAQDIPDSSVVDGPLTAEQTVKSKNIKERLSTIKKNLTELRHNFDAGKNIPIRPPSYGVLSPATDDASSFSEENEKRSTLEKLKALRTYRPPDTFLLGCYSDTRKEQIREICNWALRKSETQESSNIFWLTGSPGSGKTAILRNLIAEVQTQQCFGAFFTFQPRSSPSAVWTNIASSLYSLHPALRRSIRRALEGIDDIKTLKPSTAFLKLIYQPLKDVSDVFSGQGLVFVIDAVDQCPYPKIGDVDASWHDLQWTIAEWSRLPGHFKLIISSWHLSHLDNYLSTESVLYASLDLMEERALISSNSDIKKYLGGELRRALHYGHTLSSWQAERDLAILTSHSAGLFFWAHAVIKQIAGDSDKMRQLSVILVGGPAAPCDAIDQLYNNVLERCFKSIAPIEWAIHSTRLQSQELNSLRRILGFIALAKGLLSIPVLRRLLDIEGTILQEKLLALSPVIHFDIRSSPSIVKYRHHTMAEFILSANRAHEDFAVDSSVLNRDLTGACLRIISEYLKGRVDFLKVTTSYNLRPVPQFKHSSLTYACRFWAVHLSAISGSPDSELLLQLHSFFENSLLAWFEALVSLGVVRSAVHILDLAAQWLTARNLTDLTGFAEGARRFISEFCEPVSHNVAHVYLSGVPFSEADSQLFKGYRKAFSSTLQVSREINNLHLSHVASFSSSFMINVLSRAADQRAVQALLRSSSSTHTVSSPSVSCMALAPSGDRIALGMSDSSICVLRATTGTPVFILAGHRHPVKSISYGKRHIVSGDSYGLILLWDPQTGNLTTPLKQLGFGRDSSISCVRLSPNGDKLAFCAEDMTVEILDLTTSADKAILHTNRKLPGCSQWIRTMAWSADGHYVVAAGDDTKVYFWGTDSGDLYGDSLHVHGSYISALAISPDGKHIASASADGLIVLLDAGEIALPDGERHPIVLRGNTSTVSCLAFTLDSNYLLSTSETGILMMWSVRSHCRVGASIQIHDSKASGLVILPDPSDRLIVTTGTDLDQEIKLWNLTGYFAEDAESAIPQPSSILGALPTSDGRFVLASDGNYIWTWDAISRQPITEIPTRRLRINQDRDGTGPFIFSPDGRMAVIASTRSVFKFTFNIRIDPAEGLQEGHPILDIPFDVIEPPQISGPYIITGLAFSPSSDVLAIFSDLSVWLWDIDHREVVYQASFERTKGRVTALAASPHHGYVSLAWSPESGDCLVQTLDLSQSERDKQPVYETSKAHQGLIEALAFNDAGTKVASASRDNTVRVWNAENGELLCTANLRFSGSFPCALTWSPDSSHLASGMKDGSVFVFSASTGIILGGPWRAQSQRINSVAFTPDGHYVVSASADGTVRMWDTMPRPFAVVERIHRHTDWVSALAMSPDGHQIALGSHDKKITIYNTHGSASRLETWYAHGDRVTSLAFMRDGGMLVAGYIDGTVRIWDLTSDDTSQPKQLELANPNLASASITCLALAPNGYQLAVGCEKAGGHAIIRIWDSMMNVWVHARDLDASNPTVPGATITAITYSPDGTRLASASSDGTICVWDTESGQNLMPPFGGHLGPVLALAFVPSSQSPLLSGGEDGRIHLWDSKTGRGYGKRPSLTAHETRIRSVAVGAGGKRVFSGADDGTVRIWDIAVENLDDTGFLGTEAVPPLHGHAGPILALLVAQDGKRFVTSSADCTVAIWNTDLDVTSQQTESARGEAMTVRDRQGLMGDGVILDADGWLCAYGGSLRLCWVPPRDRAGLRMPRARGAFGVGEVTLDASKFVHGTKWTECFNPAQEAE